MSRSGVLHVLAYRRCNIAALRAVSCSMEWPSCTCVTNRTAQGRNSKVVIRFSHVTTKVALRCDLVVSFSYLPTEPIKVFDRFFLKLCKNVTCKKYPQFIYQGTVVNRLVV